MHIIYRFRTIDQELNSGICTSQSFHVFRKRPNRRRALDFPLSNHRTKSNLAQSSVHGVGKNTVKRMKGARWKHVRGRRERTCVEREQINSKKCMVTAVAQ